MARSHAFPHEVSAYTHTHTHILSRCGFQISLTSKVSCYWIRNSIFNPCLHEKSIDDLVWW